MRTKWFTNRLRMVRESNARMCGWDCEPLRRHPQHSPRTVIYRFFVQTQRELDAPGGLCSPQVRKKLINHTPSMNCLVRPWFAGVYQP